MSDLCPEWECGGGGGWIFVWSGSQGIQFISLSWKCVTCHDWFVSLKPYQLHLPALEMNCSKSDSVGITSLLSSVSTGWNFRVPVSKSSCLETAAQQTCSRGCLCLWGTSQPLSRKLPPSWVSLGTWLQNDCPSDESIPESNLCLLLCLFHKANSINVLLFFTEALLFFARVQHFILRIWKCNTNSDNCVRVCTLLTGSSTLGELHLVTRCLVTAIEQRVIWYCPQ